MASLIGTLSADSPLLDQKATGSVFIASPYENPLDSLIALYLVLKVPERGVVVKLPGKVAIDPQSGQLRASFEPSLY